MSMDTFREQGGVLAQRLHDLCFGAFDNPHVNEHIQTVLQEASQLREQSRVGIDLTIPFEPDHSTAVFGHKPALSHFAFLLPRANPAVREALAVPSPFTKERHSLPLVGVTFLSHKTEQATVQFDVQPAESEAVFTLQTRYGNLIRFGRLTVGFASRIR